MLPTARRVAAAATAGLLISALAVTPASAGPAAPLAIGGTSYTGFSNGTLEYVHAANLPPTVAKVGLGQSAAGVQIPGPLGTAATFDQLKQPLLLADKAGKTAYGHASGANVGILDDLSAPPAIAETLAEATSPAPSTAEGVLLDVPISPVLSARILPSSAAANTLANNSCVFGKDLGYGNASIANAEVVAPDTATAVVDINDVSQSISHERLFTSGGRNGLLSETMQSLAPITLFKGTGADIIIDVLRPIQLSASATGAPGGAVVTYGAPGASGTTPVVKITFVAAGEEIFLTSQDVFGSNGFILPLGAADLTIGGKAHSLTGLEGTAPTQLANGTLASAAVDFIRISVPGRLPTPGQDPISPDSPFADLNQVLNPVLAGLDPVLGGIQDALAGTDVFDFRIGHMEAYAQVPVNGIECGGGINPIERAKKTASTQSVSPGESFQYTITIPNDGVEPLTNVKVVDTYSAALIFVSAVPKQVSHVKNVLTFDRVKVGSAITSTIPAKGTGTIVLTFRVPNDATPGTVYRNDAEITGIYQGQRVGKKVTAIGPTVDDGGQLPRTGMSQGAVGLGMLLLLGGAVAYRRRLGTIA